jgi:putative PIN family toxin of toxin-antitoxin system
MAKVLIDTNVIISAAYSKGSVPFMAFSKATTHPNQGLICEQTIEELRRVFNRKFPDRLPAFEQFVSSALSVIKVVPVPPESLVDESKVRDADDRPILRAARKAGADILLTGDKDFLESGITEPRIMTAADFLAL